MSVISEDIMSTTVDDESNIDVFASVFVTTEKVTEDMSVKHVDTVLSDIEVGFDSDLVTPGGSTHEDSVSSDDIDAKFEIFAANFFLKTVPSIEDVDARFEKMAATLTTKISNVENAVTDVTISVAESAETVVSVNRTLHTLKEMAMNHGTSIATIHEQSTVLRGDQMSLDVRFDMFVKESRKTWESQASTVKQLGVSVDKATTKVDKLLIRLSRPLIWPSWRSLMRCFLKLLVLNVTRPRCKRICSQRFRRGTLTLRGRNWN